MKRKRALLFFIIATLLITMTFSACRKDSTDTQTPDTSGKTPESSGTSKPASVGPVVISYYRPGVSGSVLTDWIDAVWVQELEKRLNIDIDFQGPATGDDYTSAAQIMLASGTLTDLFYFNFNQYDGGLAAAIEDGVAINIGEKYRDKVPNWFKILESDERIRRAVTLEDGTSALFCHVEEDLKRGAYWGSGIRQDWLDKLNLQKPTSIDELYSVLVAFKDQDPNGNGQKDEIPLCDYFIPGPNFMFAIMDIVSAFGMLYQEPQLDPYTGKVTYWILVNDGENFKKLVTTLNKWYMEGLLDPEFMSQDGTALDAKVANDLVGVTHIWPSNFNNYNRMLREKNPKATYVGLPALKGEDGIPYGPNSAMVRPAASTEGTVITTQAEKDGTIEKCLELINFMYSEEGTDIINWGVRGVSYDIDANGKKYWLPAVANDPEYTINDMVNKYALPTFGAWPKIMSYEAWASIELNTPESEEAHRLWAEADTRLLLPNLTLGASESSDYARIMNDVNTAIAENFIKFIIGTRPLDEVSDLVKQCKDMGLEKAMSYYQSAYDRYMSK